MSVDVEFCQICGTILPLPGDLDYVVCYNEDCQHRVSIKDFAATEVSAQIFFNKIKAKTEGQQTSTQSAGPLVERTCNKCGNDKMSYTTRQTRSVDEGQTVFYLCPICNNQESEYS